MAKRAFLCLILTLLVGFFKNSEVEENKFSEAEEVVRRTLYKQVDLDAVDVFFEDVKIEKSETVWGISRDLDADGVNEVLLTCPMTPLVDGLRDSNAWFLYKKNKSGQWERVLPFGRNSSKSLSRKESLRPEWIIPSSSFRLIRWISSEKYPQGGMLIYSGEKYNTWTLMTLVQSGILQIKSLHPSDIGESDLFFEEVLSGTRGEEVHFNVIN